MEQINTTTKVISAACSSNDSVDANKTNSEEYLTHSAIASLSYNDEECIMHSAIASLSYNDEDEKRYILKKKLQQIKEAGEDIEHNINKLLETRSKLEKEGLMFYKEANINQQLMHVYKIVGEPRSIQGYYTTFNGEYAIPHKEIRKAKIFFLGDIDEAFTYLYTS